MWKPRVAKPKACPECKRRLARLKKPVGGEGTTNSVLPAVLPGRALADFRARYRREPSSEAELEGFMKRGW